MESAKEPPPAPDTRPVFQLIMLRTEGWPTLYGGVLVRMFEELWALVCDDETPFRAVDMKIFDVKADPPAYPSAAQLAEGDAVLVPGSLNSAYDEVPWVTRLLAEIRALAEARTPLLGVCFGHQAIAKALGGDVAKNPRGTQASRKEFACPLPLARRPAVPAPRSLLYHHNDVVTRMSGY